jgi:hypothetical protein
MEDLLKFKLLPAMLAAMAVGYLGSALMPSSVSAAPVATTRAGGTFTQDHGPKNFFIHITSADILHNNPCGPNPDQTPLTTCPLMGIIPKGL